MKCSVIALTAVLACTLPAKADWGWGQASYTNYTPNWCSGDHSRHSSNWWKRCRGATTLPRNGHLGDPRPRAWCGWWLRHKLGVASTAYNLARSWFGWGRPSGPCVGCVAVSSHHVGLITGGGPGHWIVEQGNPYRNGLDRLRWAVAYRSP